jgi:CBS domain-containing protein
MDGTTERWSTGGQTPWVLVAARDEPGRGAIPVFDVMRAATAAVPSWLPVAAARKVAVLKAVDHLLVEQDGRLTGIVSGIDMDAASDETAVGALAKSLSLSVRPTTPLARARGLMLKNGVGYLPVVAGAWLIGVVTRDAVERALRARDHRAPESARSFDHSSVALTSSRV